MLSQTLKWLEADGFVHREARPTVPPHVEYTLTPLGIEVGQRVAGLADWIETNLPKVIAPQHARSQAAGRATETTRWPPPARR